MIHPTLREANLTRIKKRLEEWLSMLPQCVAIGSRGPSAGFSHNGTYGLHDTGHATHSYLVSPIETGILRGSSPTISSPDESRHHGCQV